MCVVPECVSCVVTRGVVHTRDREESRESDSSGTMWRVTPPSPTARRISTPSWFDLRLVLGVVLVLASVLLGASIVSNAGDTQPALAVSRDLAAGTILSVDDLVVRQVKLPEGGTGVYLTTPDEAVGRTLDRAVAGGELLAAAAIVRTPARTRITVPLASGAAPKLRAGQRVELWLSSADCAFVVLLPDVTVQTVSADDNGSFTNGTGGQNVVISVTPAQAGRVVAALAITDKQIRAGVLEGSGPGSAPSSAVAGPPVGGGLPADLVPCAGTTSGR